MKNAKHRAWVILSMVGLVAIANVARLTADLKKEKLPKPSSYASAADLQNQLDYFLGRIETDLEDEKDFSEDQQQRIARDANTLAVLALVLGMHDQQNQLKRTAPGVIQASTNLAESSGDFKAANGALAELKKSLSAKNQSGKVQWEAVGDIQQLMLQVPIVNNYLRRSVTGRRFERSVEENTGYAATLAAIAQISMFDTNYCSDEKDEARWIAICTDMRNAAAEVSRASRRKDQAAAKVGLKKLVKTCDACHESFR